MTDPQAAITLILANAENLRAKGVARLVIGDIQVELYPAVPTGPEVPRLPRELFAPSSRSPLDDPATFGVQRDDAGVPGFVRDSNVDEDAQEG